MSDATSEVHWREMGESLLRQAETIYQEEVRAKEAGVPAATRKTIRSAGFALHVKATQWLERFGIIVPPASELRKRLMTEGSFDIPSILGTSKAQPKKKAKGKKKAKKKTA